MFAIHLVVVVVGGEHGKINRWRVLIINNFAIQIRGLVWIYIIYAAGKSLIKHGFGCVCIVRGSLQVLETSRLFSYAIRQAHVEYSSVQMFKGVNVWCGRSDDDDNQKQTATSRLLKREKTFINRKHSLNRSLLLFSALLDDSKRLTVLQSVNGNCVMNYERWKQRTNAKESEENSKLYNQMFSFKSSRTFGFLLLFLSWDFSENSTSFHRYFDELFCRYMHMRRHLFAWSKSQIVLIEN